MSKFEPMPKRFMVWDSKERDFIPYDDNFCFTRDEDNNLCLCDIDWRAKDLVEVDRTRYIICQSTNIFDKDGKEIFEGGVVDYNDDGSMLGVVVNEDGEWCLNDKNGNRMFLKGAPHQKLIGHILSNPELLEVENV